MFYLSYPIIPKHSYVGRVVDWLKLRARDQHGLGSKPTHAIVLCSWKRHFTAHSPAWWSWKAVLNHFARVNSKRDGEIEICVLTFKSYYTLILKRKFGL